MTTAFTKHLPGAAEPRAGDSAPSAGLGDTGGLLAASGIVKSYRTGVWPRRRRIDVLRGAELVLWPGEIVGLVGENGSGKSTFMKILVGALDRDGGVVARDGSIGYCPQEPILYERLTCDEHFELFGRAYGMDPASVAVARGEIYDTLNFASYQDTRVEELSGGTRAKLNLGVALLPDPGVLLLDEPYAGFDWETYQRFWEVARARRDRGRGVLIVSHLVADEERFDRIVHLEDGRTVPA